MQIQSRLANSLLLAALLFSPGCLSVNFGPDGPSSMRTERDEWIVEIGEVHANYSTGVASTSRFSFRFKDLPGASSLSVDSHFQLGADTDGDGRVDDSILIVRPTDKSRWISISPGETRFDTAGDLVAEFVVIGTDGKTYLDESVVGVRFFD